MNFGFRGGLDLGLGLVNSMKEIVVLTESKILAGACTILYYTSLITGIFTAGYK